MSHQIAVDPQSAGSARKTIDPARAEASRADTAQAGVESAQAAQPRFFDTYALVYGFSLTFLVPGLLYMSTLPFRTYTFQYVGAFGFPILLGLAATFFTDSADGLKTKLIRSAILVPLAVVTGVTVLFVGSLTAVPVSPYLNPENYGTTTPFVVALLALLASPLVFAVVKRVRTRLTWRSLVQLAALLVGLAVAAGVAYLMLRGPGELKALARKDITIYVTGAVMWYLPSFGIAAGAWRAVDLV